MTPLIVNSRRVEKLFISSNSSMTGYPVESQIQIKTLAKFSPKVVSLI
jgi:hypothetical protein